MQASVLRKTNKNRHITNAKNVMRGALSNKSINQMEVLSKQIDALPLEDFRVFASWLNGYPSRRTHCAPVSKIEAYRDLWVYQYLTITDLGKAIQWNARLLAANLSSLNTFAQYLGNYEDAHLSGRYEEASQLLDKIEAELGV